jgi:hypothetical protein
LLADLGQQLNEQPSATKAVSVCEKLKNTRSVRERDIASFAAQEAIEGSTGAPVPSEV